MLRGGDLVGKFYSSAPLWQLQVPSEYEPRAQDGVVLLSTIANVLHLRATACSSRRELLSPGVGLQPPRKGICTIKNITSGAFFGFLLTVFRTGVASKSRHLLEATRFYFT